MDSPIDHPEQPPSFPFDPSLSSVPQSHTSLAAMSSDVPSPSLPTAASKRPQESEATDPAPCRKLPRLSTTTTILQGLYSQLRQAYTQRKMLQMDILNHKAEADQIMSRIERRRELLLLAGVLAPENLVGYINFDYDKLDELRYQCRGSELRLIDCEGWIEILKTQIQEQASEVEDVDGRGE